MDNVLRGQSWVILGSSPSQQMWDGQGGDVVVLVSRAIARAQKWRPHYCVMKDADSFQRFKHLLAHLRRQFPDIPP